MVIKTFKIPLLILLALVLLGNLVKAQQLNTDSLKKLIQETKDDTVKIVAMQTLANYFIKHDGQEKEGLDLLLLSRNLSLSSGFKRGIAQSYLTEGNYHRSKSEWAESINCYEKAIEYGKQIPEQALQFKMQMMSLNNLGGVFNSNGDYNQSLQYRLQSLAIAESASQPDPNHLGIIFLNICSDYRKLQLSSKGLGYLQKAEALEGKMNDVLKMELYFEAFQYYDLDNNAEALKKYLEKMDAGLEKFNLSAFQKKDFAFISYQLHSQFALNYLKNQQTALHYNEKALALAKELKKQSQITETLLERGITLFQFGKTREAQQILYEAYEMAKADSLSGLELRVVNQLAAVEMKLNNPTTANNLLLESVKLSNAIYNTNKSAELNFLEARYQHEKRQKELSAMQAEVAAQKVEMIKKNRLLWIGALGVGAALLVLFLLFKANRSRLMLAKKDQQLKEEQIKFLERQQQVISLQSMINGQETERTRIAKDLHDGLGGLFSTVKMYLSTLKHEEQQLASKDLFTKSYDLVNNASQEVRRIAHNMMPEVLIKMGLVQAVQEMCDNVNAGKILQMQLLSYGMEKRLPVSMEMMLFRILQELVNNIIKHSEATKAVIQFNKNGNQITIIVEDNGKGFAGEREDAHSHIGLDTIKSRVDFLNGEFSIDSEKGIGTTAMLQFTLDEQSGEGTEREW